MDRTAPGPAPEIPFQHERFVRRVALGIAGRESDVDDLVQETWLVVLRTPPRTFTNLRAWLRRVIQARASNARAAERARCSREHLAGSHAQSTPAPEELLDQLALREEVRDAVGALDAIYQDVVRLRYYDGLGLAEIAEQMGLPEETVRTRLRRALEKLRAWFDRRYEDRPDHWMPALLLAGGPFEPSLPRDDGSATRGGRS
jgi:RNA polymerase sigma-70 factor, ECF subfamily